MQANNKVIVLLQCLTVTLVPTLETPKSGSVSFLYNDQLLLMHNTADIVSGFNGVSKNFNCLPTIILAIYSLSIK